MNILEISHIFNSTLESIGSIWYNALFIEEIYMKQSINTFLLFALVFTLGACGSTKTEESANTVAFGNIQITALNQTTINIAWSNPGVNETTDIVVSIKSDSSDDNVTIPSTQFSEIQYTDAQPDTNYQITLSTTLADGTVISSEALSISTPQPQTGDYSTLTFDTGLSCGLLTCDVSWTWNHPTNPESYVSNLLLQRKKDGGDYWRTVSSVDPETSTIKDETLAMNHGEYYFFRVIVIQLDGTAKIDTIVDPFTLSYDIPNDLVANMDLQVITNDFSLSDVTSMIQPTPFEFTMEFTLDRSYTFNDLVNKIGAIQIRPLVHVTNYETSESTFLSDIPSETVDIFSLLLNDLQASAQDYSEGATMSYSSELILGSALFLNDTDPEDWYNYEMFVSFQLVPVDTAFAPQSFWLYDFDEEFIDPTTTERLNCSPYNCYKSLF